MCVCVCVCVSVCVALAGDGGGREVLMYQQRDHIRTTFYPRPKILLYVHNIILKQESSMIIPRRLLCPWDSPDKNTGVGSHSLLQGIFLTQGWNPSLPYCRQILYHLGHEGNPTQ